MLANVFPTIKSISPVPTYVHSSRITALNGHYDLHSYDDNFTTMEHRHLLAFAIISIYYKIYEPHKGK